MLVSPDELAELQTIWEASLDTTCVVTHTPVVDDGAGSQTAGTPTTRTYACRVVNKAQTPHERVTGGVVTAVSDWEIGLPWNAVVAAGDTITANGCLFQVDDTDIGRSVEYGCHVWASLLRTA